MNIVFAGTPEFAAAALAALINNRHNIVAVYTQPDRPAGRGKKLLQSPVKQLAEHAGIPVYQPEKLNSAEAQAELAALKPDIMIVAAYGIILPESVLNTPRSGCVNIHASLLPRWRGAAPIQRAIQAGDKETGITIMQMDAGLDTGAMLLRKRLMISDVETGGSLHDRLADLGAEAILEYLNNAEQLNSQAEIQDDALANYAHKLSKQEAEIDWHQEAAQICRNIRAFNPWPVSYINLGKERIRIFEASLAESKGATSTPGQIIEKSKHGTVIACGKQAIRIEKLQLPGAKVVSASDFYNSGKNLLNPGDQLLVTPRG